MTAGQIRLPKKLVEVFSGEALFRGAYGGRGSGKCLGAGTKVLRADATIAAVEDIRAGDTLLGPDGKPRTVLNTVTGSGPLYRVLQKTGMSYVVNDAHVLVLERSESAARDYGSISRAGNRQRRDGRYAGYVDRRTGYSLITAAEYAEKPERFKAQHFGVRRSVVGMHKALPVDPYFLGMWLGDGTEKAPEITNPDPEIIAFIYSRAEEESWVVHERNGTRTAPTFYIGSEFSRAGSFLQQLRVAGVYRNKHIPEDYFNASTEQRLALLAGLVDTDGHVSTGCIDISQSRVALLDDIVRLAHGLGFKASKRYKRASCGGKFYDSWKCQIGGDIDRLPLQVARKREGAKVRKNKDWRRTRVDVEPIGIGTYYGFELDGDHLFMLADGTVTHNSRSFATMSAVHGLRCAMAGESGVIVCGREFQNSLDDSSMAEVKAAIESESWLAQHYEIGEKYIRTRDGRIDYLFVGLRRNIESVKSTSRIRLLWVDEAEQVSEAAWQKAIPTVREDGAEIWICWNPERRASATNQRFRVAPPANSKIVEVNWRDNPWFPKVLDQIRRDDQEKRPDQYEHIWEGDYATAAVGAYYATLLAEAQREGRIGRVTKDPLMAVRAFCDLGGTGAKSDAFAMWIAQFVGREIRILDYYEAVGQPLATHLDWMRQRGWEKAKVWLPHDGATHDRVHDVSFESAFRDAGFAVEVVPNQGRGAARARIEALRRLLPACWFNEETTTAGREALSWYHERRSDDHREVGLGPEHDFSSHGCFVGETEVLTRYGTHQMMDLPSEGEVLTPCGWKRYINPRITRRDAQLVEVVFASGYTVRCTPDHLFLTESGWKSAGCLRKGSLIRSTLIRSPSISTAVFSGSTRAKSIWRATVSAFTGRFGRWLSGRSPPIAISITGMAMFATTGSTISSAHQPAIISASSVVMGGRISLPRRQPRMRGRELPSGIAQRRGDYGTAGMPSDPRFGRSGSASLSNALNAVQTFWRWSVKAIARFIAPAAARLLRIESVRRLNETADVWDITVPGERCFSLANGAVVHNSDAAGLMAIAYETPVGRPKKINYPAMGIVAVLLTVLGAYTP